MIVLIITQSGYLLHVALNQLLRSIKNGHASSFMYFMAIEINN